MLFPRDLNGKIKALSVEQRSIQWGNNEKSYKKKKRRRRRKLTEKPRMVEIGKDCDGLQRERL